jgi:hypothetical protein
MTQGFYERIGVGIDAPTDEIKTAYRRAVAHLMRRREATLAQGGDTEQLDHGRAQLDEAWSVLSDASRRRRYDAMLAVARDGVAEADVDDLWKRVSGAMVHPSLAAAARLVDAATQLGLGDLPDAPRPVERSVGYHEEVTLSDRVATDWGAPRQVAVPPAPSAEAAPTAPPTPAVVVPLPSPRGADLRVVDDRAAGDVVELRTPPTAPPPPAPASVHAEPPTSSSEFDGLIGQLGPSGALLKAVREQRGLSIQDLADTTRIASRYIQAVEDEAFEVLPSTAAFVRGYVREISRQLELDVDRVVEGYMRCFRDHG